MSNKITITTRHGEWTTTESAIKAATWERESNMETRSICLNGDEWNSPDWAENHTLTIHRAGDECDWSGIETDNLKAADADGREVLLHVSANIILDEDGRSEFIAYPKIKGVLEPEASLDYWNDDADIRLGDWNEHVSARYWMDVAGHPSEGAPEIDYAEVAAEWINDNCDERTRFWRDDCRGFANEWTLYIDPQGREALTLGDLDGTCNPDQAENLREISREDATHYIADAVMSGEDYERAHAAVSCVCAIMLDAEEA